MVPGPMGVACKYVLCSCTRYSTVEVYFYNVFGGSGRALTYEKLMLLHGKHFSPVLPV